MKKLFPILAWTAILCLMAACASRPSYHLRDKYGVGYSDMPLADDTYKVSFRGNRRDSQDDVHDHFLHRCAELGLQIQKPFFVVENEERTSYTHDRGTTSFTNVDLYGNDYGHSFGGSYYGHTNANAQASTHTYNDKFETYEHVGIVHYYTPAKKPANAYNGLLIMQRFPQKKEVR